MEQIFESILRTSLSGGVIILVILALRLVLKNTPKRFICLLWLLAMVRLLVPFSIESPLSLQPDPDQFTPSQPEHSVIQEDIPADPMVPEEPIVTPSVTIPGSSSVTNNDAVIGGTVMEHPDIVTMNTSAIYAGIWAAAACGFLAYIAVSYLLLKRKVRDAVRVDDDIYECAAIDSPFLLGYILPRIYLPVGLLPQDIDHILAHEQTHIRRMDNWTKLLMFVCLALHWFNPLVWVAYILLCRDIEIACDETVITDMEISDRKAYSAALLRCAAGHRLVSACPVAFGEVSVKQRIPKVLNYRKPAFWLSLVAIVAIIFVAVCFLTNPVAPEPPTGIEWLRQLQAEDVASVKFTVSETPLSYTEYAGPELQEIVSLLRSCDATETGGGWAFVTDNRYFYITMRDGSVHRIGICSSNVYTVEIDGIYYSNCEEWIRRLPTEGEVQVDMVEWSAQVLENACGGDTMYLHIWNKDGNSAQPDITWRRDGANWERITDDGGTCEKLLHYDGFQFRLEYCYMDNDTVLSDSGWQKTSFNADIDLPWPLNATQDPADWALVDTAKENGALTVTLRYKSDGTLLHLSYQGSSPYTFFDLEYTDGTVTCGSFMDPSSVGTGLILMGEYAAATAAHDTQLKECREALDNWKNMSSRHLRVDNRFEGDDVLNDSSTADFWRSGDRYLRISYTPLSGSYHQTIRVFADGKLLTRQYTGANEGYGFWASEWEESSTPVSALYSWVDTFDWDAHSIQYVSSQTNGEMTVITLSVTESSTQNGEDPLYAGNPYTVSFSFTADGTLDHLMQTGWTEYETTIDGETVHGVQWVISTYHLVPDDAEQIAAEIDHWYANAAEEYEE